MPVSRRAGGISKRCECRGTDGKRLGAKCPDLAKRSHGRARVMQELPETKDGTRRRFQRTGYDKVADAQRDLDRVRAILDLVADDDSEDARRIGDFLQTLSRTRGDIPEPAEVARKLGVGVPLDGRMTVGEWLERWLASKKISPTTRNGYASHIRMHLKPRLGHHRLDRLSVGHVQEMFDAIADESDVIRAENEARREQEARARWPKPGRPPAKERERLAAERERLALMKPYRRTNGPATRHAIRRTLRTALNAAIGRQMITFNAAKYVELGSAARPKGLLWTDERVQRWRETGAVPSPVMVWTPAQLGHFLDVAEDESELYALYHLVAHHGLRRGEGVGADWANAHLDSAPPRIDVLTEIVVDGWTPLEKAPKTDSSMASVMLDRETVRVLREHQARQAQQKAACLEAGKRWTETGKVFTDDDGSWLHPDVVSREFRRIVELAGLPPINLRDLRHGAAALVKAGGGDIHDAKTKLRHSTITLTSDTYMELFTEYEEALTERSAAAVPRARRERGTAPAPGLEPGQGPMSATQPASTE